MTGVRVEVFSHSEAGGHAFNEDAFALLPLPADPSFHLGVVADGQGGQLGGGEAAALACEVCVTAASRFLPNQLLQAATWAELLRAADREVCRRPGAGLTTLVAFCLGGGQLFGASSGDSAAVLLRPGLPAQELTARQRKNPPVGSGGAVPVPFAERLAPPWTVLAMSDGVWKYSGWERIRAVDPMRPGAEIIESLREAARLPGSGRFQDDFTLLVLQGREA